MSRDVIRKALSTYNECSEQDKKSAGIELVRAARNGIEVLGGITAEELYADRVAFSKLVRLVRSV